MPNYKQIVQSGIYKIDIGGVVIGYDPTKQKVIKLYHSSSLTTAESIINRTDGTNYQVPSGKKVRIFYIVTQTNGATNVNSLSQSDADDALTNPVTLIDTGNNSNAMTGVAWTSISIPADKYIVVKCDIAQAHVWDIYILEENA